MLFSPNRFFKDEWIWAYTKDGKYSVKSGSWLAVKPIVMAEPVTETIKRVNGLKEKVWKLKIVPKVKLFIWHALSGALAVSDCLRSHGMQAVPLCSI